MLQRGELLSMAQGDFSLPSQKKAISELLPGFAGTITHQSNGNLASHLAGSSV